MIKAEINKNHVSMEVTGDLATILSETHNFIENLLSSIENTTEESKQQLLLLLTQNILKEWSEEK